MEIRVKINQVEALRQGIDAPQSTGVVQINPAEDLNQEQREKLASKMHQNGHDAGIVLTSPTKERLIAELDRLIEADKENERKREENQRRIEESLKEKIRNYMNKVREVAGTLVRHYAYLNEDGRLVVRQEADEGDESLVAGPVEVDAAPEDVGKIRIFPSMRGIDMNLDEQDRQFVKEASKAYQEAMKEAEQSLKASEQWQSFLRRKEEEERVTDERRKALYARLPKILQEKDAEGLASKDEVLCAMKRLVAGEVGLARLAPEECWIVCGCNSNSNAADPEEKPTLSDTGYRKLRRARDVIGAERVFLGHFNGYRDARDDDDPCDIDSDGDVDVNAFGIGVRIPAVEFGIEVEAFVPFYDIPEDVLSEQD